MVLRRILALLILGAVAAMTMAASPVTNFDGRHVHVWQLSASATHWFTADSFDFNGDGSPDWSRITGVGIKNGSSATIDSLGYNTGNSFVKMPYPANSVDFFALDMRTFRTLENAPAKPDTAFMFQTNAGITWLYLFGE